MVRSILFAAAMVGFAGGCDMEFGPPRPVAQPGGVNLPADPAPQPMTTELVPAEAGVGKKGRGYGGGIVSEPIRQKFILEQKIVLEFAVVQALQLYEAEKGYAPKSHEEFMKDIIEANQIHLPELPAGDEYVYDPMAKQLMVRRQVPAPAEPTPTP